MKRLFAVLLSLILTLSVLAGCGQKKTKFITEAEALAIAIEAAGVDKKQVSDAHTHVGSYDGKACYSIHITAGSDEFEIVIEAATGNVLVEKTPR